MANTRRRRARDLGFIVLLLSPAWPAGAEPPVAPAPGPLTLRQAVAMAVAGNPGLTATRIRALQVQATLDESRAPFLPTVSAAYAWNRGDWPHIMIAHEIDARSFPANGYFNDPGTFTVYSAVFEARMNLWAGGRDRARRRMLTTAREICGTEDDTARNTLVGQVIETYYEVLAASARLADAERLVATARAVRDEQRQRFAAGAALRADLADTEARLAEAEAGVAQVTAARSRALAGLAIALGLPAATDLALLDEDVDETVPDGYQAGLARALQSRPELARARLETTRLEAGVTMAKAQFSPRLDTSWSLGFSRDGDPLPKLSREQKVWYANVSLSWEVFDGGARRARVAKAKAEVDESRELNRQAILGIELDVRSAYLRIDAARQQLAAAERRLEAARESRNVRSAQRQEGTATVASELEGEQMLTDALVARTNAAFELRKALADAGRATGLYAGAGR